MKKQPVLIATTPQIIARLKANPGGWYAVASGPVGKRHTYAQTALRIRNGEREGFGPSGAYEATVVTDYTKDEPCELLVRLKPTSDGGDAVLASARLSAESLGSASEPEHHREIMLTGL